MLRAEPEAHGIVVYLRNGSALATGVILGGYCGRLPEGATRGEFLPVQVASPVRFLPHASGVESVVINQQGYVRTCAGEFGPEAYTQVSTDVSDYVPGFAVTSSLVHAFGGATYAGQPEETPVEVLSTFYYSWRAAIAGLQAVEYEKPFENDEKSNALAVGLGCGLGIPLGLLLIILIIYLAMKRSGAIDRIRRHRVKRTLRAEARQELRQIRMNELRGPKKASGKKEKVEESAKSKSDVKESPLEGEKHKKSSKAKAKDAAAPRSVLQTAQFME